ncbi:MAG: cell division protein ZapE [Pseudomonadota bacterium]
MTDDLTPSDKVSSQIINSDLNGPLARYRAMIAAGDIHPDPAQVLAIEKLQLLANRLSSYKPPKKTDLFSFFTRRKGAIPDGLYIFGGVGRGKTMLMDLFYETVDFQPKQRVHFHEFMAEVHQAIGEKRKTKDGDPIPYVAQDIAKKGLLLCFDEFHVTDIADAMILWRLFAGLFEHNVVIVATSNVQPKDLYKDGLNRNAFLPFIDLIEERMELFALEAKQDYRLEKFRGEQLYFSPLDDNALEGVNMLFRKLTRGETGHPYELHVKGRSLPVREVAMGVARFDFAELCDAPLGSIDYITIARTFHTVVLENIPILEAHRRNAARRFNTLIDTLYDHGVGLVVSAEAEPEDLYPQGDGAFLFERTVSRLNEMRSMEYLRSRKIDFLK